MDVLIETLAEEFTGLFVAPGCISPYASVFETGCMYKEPADRAFEAYREAGWEYQRRMSGEFPDHIGTMLGFCGLLADAEAESLVAGELRRADELKGMRERFLVDQLGSWAPGWCHLAAEAALHPFYQGVLNLTEALLWSELAQIVDRRRMRELAELNRREPKRLDYDADFRKASGL
jgi:TorA maturation chaperone TorD